MVRTQCILSKHLSRNKIPNKAQVMDNLGLGETNKQKIHDNKCFHK